jgi:hypothetical protein
MVLLIPFEWLRADSEGTGIVQVTSGGEEEIVRDFLPLAENEAYYYVMKDGIIVGGSTIPTGEDSEVIIQIKGAPLKLLQP